MTKMYAFRGDKAYTPEQVREQLGLVGHDPRGLRSGAKRFLMPIGECEFTLNAIFDELVRDSWPVKSGNRPQRCIGTSLATAIYLLEAAYPKQGARVMLFAGGAASYGPGQIVGVSLEETIRTAKDVKDENVKYMKAATNFYNQLAVKAILNGHAVDIFNCAIDQIGLMEMKNLPDKTGGYMLLTDSFGKDEFKSSLQKVFTTEASGALSMGFGANIDIFTSRDVKCSGCIGPVTSTKKKSAFVSDVEIGQGATSQWAMSSVDTYTTLAFYLDIVAQNRDPNRKKGVVQIHTRYQHASGRMRLRVTSLGYKYAETQSVAEYIPGFDQECAATIMARLSVFKSEQEELLDVIRWLDRTLIRLVSRFGDYQKDQPSTFRLCKEFTFYPQFIFHLRRSQFLQTFNVSPDESAYYRTLLARENIINSVVMIQPALLAYSVENPQPEPVQLDIISLKNNCILLLDTFFHVLIWHGDTIVKWRNDGYAENPEFEYFRDLLRYPQEDAADICALRFPVPKLSLCDTGQGAERFLKAKVNPSTNTASNAVSETGLYITDDVSLKVFMDHLVRLAVQS